MRTHSLLWAQFNTARVVAILTPHLAARADCYQKAVFVERRAQMNIHTPLLVRAFLYSSSKVHPEFVVLQSLILILRLN